MRNKYFMDQFDDDHAYQILFRAFAHMPYTQNGHWGIKRDFKLDPLWAAGEHGILGQDPGDINADQSV
jgi:hypothetical protein